jgi:hypothetical protein
MAGQGLYKIDHRMNEESPPQFLKKTGRSVLPEAPRRRSRRRRGQPHPGAVLRARATSFRAYKITLGTAQAKAGTMPARERLNSSFCSQ